MTDEQLAGQPGGVTTRPDDEPGTTVVDAVFTPQDFRLNLGTRLAVVDDEPLPNLDSPGIRKLTWEHVVPDRPASSAPSAATLVPLPPPRRVPPPPPIPVASFQPPAPVPVPEIVDDEPDVMPAIADDIDDDTADRDDTADCDVELVDDDLDEDLPESPVSPVSVVRPQVNRLALVPDLVDDDSPVELPAITPSGPVVAHVPSVYAPVLAETLFIPAPARTAPAAAVVATSTTATKRKPNRKPKRHLLRTFMTLVVLFGLLGGGAFAAKKYLLHQPTWSVELKPLADEVAAARDLQFKVAVEVTPLPVADYAARLAGVAIDSPVASAPTWRALGLLNGELDLEAIGRQAMNDQPAFYDPTSKSILVSNDLQSHEHLYRFALRRALTMALLDQQFGWSSRTAAASPASALAIRATVDGDALSVANALAINDAPEQLAPELLAFVQGHGGGTVAPSQYAATITGRAGVAQRPMVASMARDAASLAALEQVTPNSDELFDLSREPASVASPPGTQGMMFWYYVLAGRIDDGQAWSAAVRWMGDSVATSTGSANQCVDAKVAAADADGAAVLLTAFAAWAAAAPAESTTTVVPIDGNQVAIRACDPGAALSAQAAAKIPVVFGAAGVERALVHAALSTAGDTTIDPSCLITAARQRGTLLTSPADDAPVLAVGWQPAYVAANLDLASGCVVAAAAPG